MDKESSIEAELGEILSEYRALHERCLRQAERIAELEKQVSDLTQTEHKSFIEYRNSLPGIPTAKRQAVIEKHYRAGRVSMRAEILDKLGSVARKSLGENNE